MCVESLADCQRRVVQYWNETILPELQLGSNVLLVAHANTQRALIAYLEDVPPDDVPHIHIPNSVPCIYRIDSETGMSLYPDGKTTSSLNGTTTTTASKGHWLLNEENQHRLAEKLGMTSESFARSVFDAWDVNGDGVLSKEELATGLFTWKNAQDRALSTLAGKLFEEVRRKKLDNRQLSCSFCFFLVFVLLLFLWRKGIKCKYSQKKHLTFPFARSL